MSKLRYVAPVVVTATAVGTVLVPAGQALATTKDDACNAKVCLYYSAGAGSAIWKTNEEIAWPDFTSDYGLGNPPGKYDEFTNGTGAGTGVRNNTHSMADDNIMFGAGVFSLPETRGVSWGIGADHTAAVALPTNPDLRNNDASYKSYGCADTVDSPPRC
jgi:hypothetical protein